ncbi:MAG: fumarylacetoacetate hydrolase family protein [Rhodoblastus sp.]
MNYVFAPPATVSIPVAGGKERFPVRRVICVGRNYEAHAREMGRDPTREPPFFFYKPADTIVPDGSSVPYPPETNNFQYEMELVVVIGKDGADIAQDKALDHVFGYTVGLDLTRRDLQMAARELGRPWDWGKGFDRSAPISPIQPAAKIGHPARGRIWLKVNGAIKQDADIADLIWNVPEIIAFASRSIELKAGDVIMTGTPAGVGAIVAGDKVEGAVEGVAEISITVAPAK